MPEPQSKISQPLGAAYICYIATSPEDLFGLKAQLSQIQACAASEGVELVKIYSDLAPRDYKHKYHLAPKAGSLQAGAAIQDPQR
jgi:hypothetical protein